MAGDAVLDDSPAERGTVQFGATEIAYTVTRSRRRKKTIEITLDHSAGVLVAAPLNEALRRLKVPVYRVTDAESLQRAGRDLAEQQAEWLISLGRHLPGLRAALAEHLTSATSAANAQIALISALPGVLPIAEILLPPAAVADIVFLTKNQILLVIKLAALYGEPIDLVARLWEVAPVIGGAFGWRALARELVGVVPGGVGVIAKGSVAYAGTYTVGRAAQIYYAHGNPPSAEERQRIYHEALERARAIVTRMADRLRHAPASGDEVTG